MRGVAGTLVNEGIPAVLAQQANFTYELSQRASEAWYTALTAGQSFAEALFEVRQALTQADRPDWAVPILLGSAASLAPVLDATALPGPTDPLLTSVGAAADLPAPTGVFVGRHRELRELRLMLENAPGTGPVMALITGPGGVGKSTLAAQAVTRYGGTYKAALTLSCQDTRASNSSCNAWASFSNAWERRASGTDLARPKTRAQRQKLRRPLQPSTRQGRLLVIDNLESVQADDQTMRDASCSTCCRNCSRICVVGGCSSPDAMR